MKKYAFPKVLELFGGLWGRKKLQDKLYCVRQFIRYCLRYLLARKQINLFENYVNQSEKLIDLFSKYRGSAYRVVCVSFVNRRFSSSQRFECLRYDLDSIQRCLSSDLFDSLLAGEKYSLIDLDWGLSVVLRMNGTFEEGFLSLEMLLEGERIYNLSFVMISCKEGVVMLIPSLQGLDRGEKAKENIKMITKKIFGMRPPVFLIILARYLMSFLGCAKLLGISQVCQVRYAPFGKKGYYVNYDELWEECGGKRYGDYYDVSVEYRKNLEEIPSQKRSLYKKRFALCDVLREEMMQSLETIGVRKCL